MVHAGLHAWDVAKCLKGIELYIPQRYFAKGCYFSTTGPSPFTRLIYPIPEEGGLGVHLTLDMEGKARYGPDVEWVDEISYTVIGPTVLPTRLMPYLQWILSLIGLVYHRIPQLSCLDGR